MVILENNEDDHPPKSEDQLRKESWDYLKYQLENLEDMENRIIVTFTGEQVEFQVFDGWSDEEIAQNEDDEDHDPSHVFIFILQKSKRYIAS